MNKIVKSILMMLALSCAAGTLNVRGQFRDPNSKPTPTPTPAPTPASRPLRGVKLDQVGTMLRQDINQFPGIYGSIRWKVELGRPSTDGGATANSINCGAVRVKALVYSRENGWQQVGHYRIDDTPREIDGYFVCNYSFTDRSSNDLLNLPHGKAIKVVATFGSFADESLNQALALQPWFGADRPRPPSGDQRIVTGQRDVTLTDQQPRAKVDFEIVYGPLQRSRLTPKLLDDGEGARILSKSHQKKWARQGVQT